MVEYNKINVKLIHTQLKKLKIASKKKEKNRNNFTNEFKNVWWKLFASSVFTDYKTKTKLRNTFQNNMSTDLKLSKAQISKIIQSGGFLGSLLSKLVGPLMKVAVSLGKNILAPLGITATTSVIDAGIQNKNTWVWYNCFNNFKRRNQRTQKMKPNNKREDF